MSERLKLNIPVDILRWIHPELRKRNGEISDIWDSGLPSEWLENVPAEPVVMTAEEALKDYESGLSGSYADLDQYFIDGHGYGHQNGRLERDLELRALNKIAKMVVRGLCGKQSERLSRDEMHTLLLSEIMILPHLTPEP